MDEKLIKDAQYRKGLSIAFFNATNAAISLVSSQLGVKELSEEAMLTKVTQYRNFFLEEHSKYYSSVIVNVGINYRAKDTIAKLEATQSMEELKSIWLSLSEDERRDGEILKVKDSIKKSYETV